MLANTSIELDCERSDLRLKEPFTISGHTFTSTPIVTVTLKRNGEIGRGEAAGVYYIEDTADKAAATIAEFAKKIPEDLTREKLRHLMPPSGARNAIDAALWELEAREQGQEVWQLAQTPEPHKLLTTITLGAEAPEKMAQRAVAYDFARALKLKLTGDADLDCERVSAVRKARPDVWMAVDPNQGYRPATIAPLLTVLEDCSVKLLEQPFRRGHESDHDGFVSPIPTAADESCLNLEELETLTGRFDVVNIKLDKCGGLTEGLLMAKRARELGLQVMVGNMVGTSLSAAPAFLLGQYCDVVDIDGPLFIAHDPEPTVTYKSGYVECPLNVWGPQADISAMTH